MTTRPTRKALGERDMNKGISTSSSTVGHPGSLPNASRTSTAAAAATSGTAHFLPSPHSATPPRAGERRAQD